MLLEETKTKDMKKSTLYFLLAAPVAFILIISSVGFVAHSPGGKTGSPTDGSTCVQCHSGTPQTASGWITTDIPVEGYEASTTYTVTLTGTHAGVSKYGFELTAENAGGQKTGLFTIVNATETELANGASAVTHTSGGTTPDGDSRTWTMEWTSPDQDEGTITFYAAVNAANGDGGNSGDIVYTTSHAVDYSSLSINELAEKSRTIYPNPANDFIFVDMNKTGNVNVIDMTGKVVKRVEMKSTKERVDISDLEIGTYFIQTGTTTEMFLKI